MARFGRFQNSSASGGLGQLKALILRFAKIHCKNVSMAASKRNEDNSLMVAPPILFF